MTEIENHPTPTIGPAAFWKLPVVKLAQEIQKRNPHGSPAHRTSFDTIKAEAAKYGAERFIGGYDE